MSLLVCKKLKEHVDFIFSQHIRFYRPVVLGVRAKLCILNAVITAPASHTQEKESNHAVNRGRLSPNTILVDSRKLILPAKRLGALGPRREFRHPLFKVHLSLAMSSLLETPLRPNLLAMRVPALVML